MGAKESRFPPTEEIICPNCPLTPIISIFLNEDAILTCEFRCPNLHFGIFTFSELFKNKNKHGNICNRCKKENNGLDKELLYCGTCKEFFCNNCRPQHDKEKESHKILIEKSRVNYTCLEHNKNFIGYCFSCLVDVCSECKRHDKHIVKEFEEFSSNESNKDTLEYYLDNYNNYIHNFKRQIHYNKIMFEEFKKRNLELLDFVKYLNDHFLYRKKSNKLNSEIIINYLNIPVFDYNVDNKVYKSAKEFEKYCKHHLILEYKPISQICTFSKNKQDFNLSRLNLVKHFSLESEQPKYFKYSSMGDAIIFFSGTCIYFLSANTSDKKVYKIRLESQIFSLNILNKNILCACIADKKNIYLYKLTSNPPYYGENDIFPEIEIQLGEQIVQVIGNFNKYLVTRAKGGVINLHKKNDEKYEIVSSSKTFSNNFDENNFELKGIWKDYLIIRDNVNVIVRDLKNPKLDLITSKIVFDYNSDKKDFLIYNGNIIVFRKKQIFFISIPNLEVESKLELPDNIFSVNIVNPRTMIVVEKGYMEQLEVDTWKRMWWKANFGRNINIYDLMPIGAGKKLFFYNKGDNNFYSTANEEATN